MPDFSPHDLNLAQGRVQVEELRSLLLAHADLREKEIRDCFESRRDLTALFGFYNPARSLPAFVLRPSAGSRSKPSVQCQETRSPSDPQPGVFDPATERATDGDR
jgi:hypothetical protein